MKRLLLLQLLISAMDVWLCLVRDVRDMFASLGVAWARGEGD